MRKIYKLLAFIVFMPMAVYAGGSRDIVTNTADGIDIWQTEFDVSNRKPGTYNIIINAKDAAGNEGISGPFNLKVDPMAGLPEARVVYPERGQVIREDVNIVGVASGRYGIKQILVKIDDGEYQELEGNEYWNLYIPAMDLPEGRHTIRVKAVDSMDITGPEEKIEFILDITPPLIEMVDREIGDLIAGNVNIKGKVTDVNGVESLFLSSDGKNFTKLSLSQKKGDPTAYFQFPIKTKSYDDGALVHFIRAVNKTGNAITRPFLFFVNNYPPQIEILSPELKENTYGMTQVIGRVTTGVGLTEFYYEWAGERHDIPLHIGDPYWTVVFHISMANNRAIPFRVTAVDKSGNVTTVVQRFQDVRKNRTPTLAIDYPPMSSSSSRLNLEPGQPVYGHILPGFFPYAIMIEDQIEYVMAQPVFRIDPELIPVGRNTMRLWAIDEDDATGPAFTLRVNKPEAPPGFEFTESPIVINSPEEEYQWYSDSVTFRGFVEDYEPGQEVEYRYRWDDPWKPVTVTSRGAFTAVISLEDFPEGAIPLEFRTVRNGKGDYPIFFPVNKFTTLPEISFLAPTPKFGAIHGDVTTSGIVSYFVPLTQVSYSIDGSEFERIEFTPKYDRAWFTERFDYSALNTHNQKVTIRVVDRAGNRVEASPEMEFDNSNDIPMIILNFPNDGDLITEQFNISGLAFDDDEIATIYWRILSPRNPWDTVEETVTRHRDVEFNRFETKQNFSMPVDIFDVADGENVLEVFAEDVFGTSCEIIRRVFRVSTAAPVTVVMEPAMDLWNKGNIMVSGTAFDLNGIDNILVSMDNGVSYQKADFTSSQQNPSPWKIALNTKAYSDGIYSMLVRTVDKYGVSSFTNGIVNIDNTPPEIDLGTPHNGDKVGVTLHVSGQIYDNVALTRIAIDFVNVDNPNLRRAYDLPNEFVVMEAMDVSSFPDGDYTVKITAYDQSKNETSVIRNVNILKARAASEVAIINPLPGISHSGPVVVSGKITGAVIPETVTLLLNRQQVAVADVDRYGFFRYDLPDDAIQTEDPVIFSAFFITPSGEQIMSVENLVRVSRYGPILEIDSHKDGDVITKRPWISGRAFFTAPEPEPEPEVEVEIEVVEEAKITSTSEPDEEGEYITVGEEEKISKKASKEKASRKKKDDNTPWATRVELSFDNGRSFDDTKGTDEWRYRLETGELEPGPLPIVIKATFNDGSVAVRRIILTVDTRPPMVHTIGPPENSSHRTSVMVYGSAGDDFDMDKVEVSLRPGNKAGYSVPGFIQGLYIDGNALGGLQFMVGLGLTFFEDNVKVQFNAAKAPEGTRYSGWAFGGKILANVYTKNLGGWFGPDWEFWTTSFTLGAHFSYFLMEGNEKPTWMGQFLGQWEIIKADLSFFFPKWKYFKTISLYTEPGIWFAPSDVDSKDAWRTKFTIAFGARISLF